MLETSSMNGGYRQMHYYRNDWFNCETPEGKELILRPFFLKRIEYQSEREIRFVVIDTTKLWMSGDSILLENVPLSWIQQIVLGPGLTKPQIVALKKTISAFGDKIPCEASGLQYGRKQEMRDRHEELDKMVPKGKDDGIPEFLKSI